MRRSTLLLSATIGFGVLYGAAAIVLGSTPEPGDSGQAVAAWFRDHDGQVRTWMWLLTLSLPLFATVAALVRARLPEPHRDVFFFGRSHWRPRRPFRGGSGPGCPGTRASSSLQPPARSST